MPTPPRELPTVSIVGRPNVGKSTLFNRLARSRRAIVDAVPGVTRDRLEMPVEWRGRWFRLIDTGGLDFADEAPIPRAIVEQASAAVEHGDLVVLVVDARGGLFPVERDIASLLRKKGTPVLVAANKVDVAAVRPGAAEFHALGLGDVVAVSAESGLGVDDLLDAILERLPNAGDEPQPDERVRIAVVGRPNVGKSSLVNRLVGEERVIVSAIPGTTRDTVDVGVRLGDLEAILVDTAGLRRKGTDRERIDHVARVMAERAVHRADVALVMLDATEGPTHQDAVIAGMAAEAGAGLVILLNKWDLVERREERHPEIVRDVRDAMKFAAWAPVLTISVLTGERLHRLADEVKRVAANRRRRIPTAELNAVLAAAMDEHQPPQAGGRGEYRVRYITQVGVAPPTFVAFTTGPPPHFTFRRYLENRLREAFDFAGTPLVIRWRRNRKGDAPHGGGGA